MKSTLIAFLFTLIAPASVLACPNLAGSYRSAPDQNGMTEAWYIMQDASHGVTTYKLLPSGIYTPPLSMATTAVADGQSREDYAWTYYGFEKASLDFSCRDQHSLVGVLEYRNDKGEGVVEHEIFYLDAEKHLVLESAVVTNGKLQSFREVFDQLD
jgi:hypothetical protein